MPKIKYSKPRPDYIKALILERMQATESTTADLAEDLDCSERTVRNRMKSSTQDWTLDEITKVCKALDIPVEDLRAAIRF